MEHTATGAAVALSPTLSPLAPSSLHARAEGSMVGALRDENRMGVARDLTPSSEAECYLPGAAQPDEISKEAREYLRRGGAVLH